MQYLSHMYSAVLLAFICVDLKKKCLNDNEIHAKLKSSK